MTAQEKILAALKSIIIMSDGEACVVRKGYHHNGITEEYGWYWYYQPSGQWPQTLGRSLPEALETISIIREELES